ncbi:hypothetical protein HYALB_00000691 [Hymenoscyphus albidus]|uniref:Uncharacterized protein n=1 Tax=Hymenoscyphus albidus TaxID=595503 RepID=A0A9N9LV13_9HELO|nr:hypothetical protein HYALB_00000691 [Hymenoscyphus albidus]
MAATMAMRTMSGSESSEPVGPAPLLFANWEKLTRVGVGSLTIVGGGVGAEAMVFDELYAAVCLKGDGKADGPSVPPAIVLIGRP